MQTQLIRITDTEARESLLQDMNEINHMIDELDEENN